MYNSQKNGRAAAGPPTGGKSAASRGTSLNAAYRATRYIAMLPGGPLTIHIGRTAPDLDRWMVDAGLNFWSWLTSVNPSSRRLGDAENADRLTALQAALDAQGIRWYGATAVADDGLWPDEPSLFVPGLARDAACDLAVRFGQAAFLHGVVGGAAELVWIDDGHAVVVPR